MASPRISVGQEVLNVDMGGMIRDMAFAIADSQIRLDENSIEVAEMMGGLKTIVDEDGKVTFEDSRVFFGTQTITLQEAVDLANATNDQSLAAEAETKIKDVDGSATGTAAGGNLTLDSATDGAQLITIPTRLSMMELGFTPTFYQFVDSIIEVKISITYTQEAESSRSLKIANTNKSKSFGAKIGFRRGVEFRRGVNVTTSQVNMAYSQKYQFTAEASSLLRTKLVPIPPPAILEERIRQTLEEDSVQPESDPES